MGTGVGIAGVGNFGSSHALNGSVQRCDDGSTVVELALCLDGNRAAVAAVVCGAGSVDGAAVCGIGKGMRDLVLTCFVVVGIDLNRIGGAGEVAIVDLI